MWKKITAVFLCVALVTAVSVPALAAEEGMDARLTQVTLAVKETLNLDDRYTQFSGNLTEQGSTSYWELSWSNDEESLNVCADVTGKVLSYSRYPYATDYRSIYEYGYAPIFPQAKQDEALRNARAFVEKVLGANETVSFNPTDSQYGTSKIDSYWFNGTVLLYGLKSPISFSVRVDAGDMSVTQFYRSDCYNQYADGVPSATPAVSAGTASALLSKTVALQLQYVLTGDGKTAVLQYLPVGNGNYIVKADTGELINLDELVTPYYGRNLDGMEEATADSSAGDKGLSEAEQSAIAALDGVYTRDQLDAAARAISELGIDSGYTLSSVNYSMNPDNNEVQTTLAYTKKITDETEMKSRFPNTYSEMEKQGIINPIYTYKYLTLDAMTGALISVYTYWGTSDEENKLSTDQMQGKAAAFLGKYFPDARKATALNETASDATNGSFVYSQTANGILFPTNSADITVNGYDGAIDNFSLSWTDGVTFDSADGIVSEATAMAAYLGCFDTVLQYVQVPVEVGPYNYSYELQLAYQYDAKQSVTGVDAKTGKAILAADSMAATPIAYDDISSCYGKTQIEKLAQYGVGFPGSSFLPQAQLTQKDALVLLLSAVGYSTTAEDDLYNVAYSYRLIAKNDRNPTKLMTRAELIKMLIGATTYNTAAELTGIYHCGFADDSSIAPGDYGYVAIAKGLGVVRGDEQNKFNPDNIVTRQDAAIILFNFMSR